VLLNKEADRTLSHVSLKQIKLHSIVIATCLDPPL